MLLSTIILHFESISRLILSSTVVNEINSAISTQNIRSIEVMRVCSYILDGLDMMKYGLPSDAKMLCVTSPELKRFSVSQGPSFLVLAV
jgi:hypothetical protein